MGLKQKILLVMVLYCQQVQLTEVLPFFIKPQHEKKKVQKASPRSTS